MIGTWPDAKKRDLNQELPEISRDAAEQLTLDKQAKFH